MKIGIAIVCTNSYFVLGIRFVKKFLHFYKGDRQIKFILYTDEDPAPYLPDGVDYSYIHTTHKNWTDGTNSKFSNICGHADVLQECDYVYYFDSDTNIDKDFTEEWFIGDLVGGEHYNNVNVKKPYDRNPRSKAYIPEDTPLNQMYYYGAFFGGKRDRMIDFCKVLYNNQLEDKKIPYEPAVNDESYINQYFHYNTPTRVVKCTLFKFLISDKGGLGETRNPNLDIVAKKALIKSLRNDVFDIQNNQIVVL